MRKQILLIGNNEGLPGVKKDFVNYQNYFLSETGGDWYNNEIISRMNPKKSELENELDIIKSKAIDFLIVIFSGHAGQEREIVLEINGDGEIIYESQLKNLAARQITIYDCCRAFSRIELSESHDRVISKSVSKESNIRKLYEGRIMQAIPQQIRLFACSMGETAIDTLEGGLYSKNLIRSAIQIDDDFKTVGKVHQLAASKTKKEREEQNPEAELIKCLTSQQLVFGLNPSLGKRGRY